MLNVEINLLDKNNPDRRPQPRPVCRTSTAGAQPRLQPRLWQNHAADGNAQTPERTRLLRGDRGDQQTVNDAARIRETGTRRFRSIPVKGCHLDAQMIADAAPRLPLEDNGILFIENVGNLVCPASFDPGAA